MVSKAQNEIKYITVAELIKLHRDILDETGGEYGVLNYGNLEFIVDFSQSVPAPPFENGGMLG